MGRVPTRRVKLKGSDRVLTINASDYDPERHEPFVGKVAAKTKAPKKKAAPDPDAIEPPSEPEEDVADEATDAPTLSVMHRGGGKYAVVDENSEPVSDLFDEKADALDALAELIGDG